MARRRYFRARRRRWGGRIRRFGRRVGRSISINSITGITWLGMVGARAAFGGKGLVTKYNYTGISVDMWKTNPTDSAKYAGANMIAQMTGFHPLQNNFDAARLVDGYAPLVAGAIIGRIVRMATKKTGISIPVLGRFKFA